MKRSSHASNASALRTAATALEVGPWSPEPSAADPRAGSLLRSFLRIEVEEVETLPAQMMARGLAPDSVAAVILTHQHIDHTAAVPSFVGADVWTTQAEDRAALQTGSNPWRWRNADTRIRHVDVEGVGTPMGPGLPASVDLVGDGSLRAVHTPGHTPGSVSVVLAVDQGEVWFTGDTSFTAATMDPSASTAGIHTDMRAVRRVQRELGQRWLLLPSHDWGNAERLVAAGV